MTKKEYQKFKRDIKPVIHCLDQVRSGFYSRSNPDKDWKLLIDLHYKYISKSKGSKMCEGCGKVFKVCTDLNRLRND